jgi:hypothetical protein
VALMGDSSKKGLSHYPHIPVKGTPMLFKEGGVGRTIGGPVLKIDLLLECRSPGDVSDAARDDAPDLAFGVTVHDIDDP